MKILFFGDSTTDMGREKNSDPLTDTRNCMFGFGHPLLIAADLYRDDPSKYRVYNTGIGGNRIVDLYARLKKDVWNYNPDVVSILIGINDVWHEIDGQKNGVDIERWEKIYRMMIDDTLICLPNVKIIICEPFVLRGAFTDGCYDSLIAVKEYAKVAKRIADDYHLPFVFLQDKLEEKADMYGADYYLVDGAHPAVAGARLITDEWLKVFKEKIETVEE